MGLLGLVGLVGLVAGARADGPSLGVFGAATLQMDAKELWDKFFGEASAPPVQQIIGGELLNRPP